MFTMVATDFVVNVQYQAVGIDNPLVDGLHNS